MDGRHEAATLGGSQCITCHGAMHDSPEWSLELASVALFHRVLSLHDLWSMGSSPRASEAVAGGEKGCTAAGLLP
jgi:hypothetical protein